MLNDYGHNLCTKSVRILPHDIAWSYCLKQLSICCKLLCGHCLWVIKLEETRFGPRNNYSPLVHVS